MANNMLIEATYLLNNQKLTKSSIVKLTFRESKKNENKKFFSIT